MEAMHQMVTKEEILSSNSKSCHFFSSNQGAVNPVELGNIDEEAGRLVKLFCNQLYDVSQRYNKSYIYGAQFQYQAAGLRTMLCAILDSKKFDNTKKLFLLISLTQDLYSYLIRWKSNNFKTLLHYFMYSNYLLINGITTPALLDVVNSMSYKESFYNYFLGGCHFFYNSAKYFAKIAANYDDFIKRNDHYECNNQKYTLEQLVENFLVVQHNKPRAVKRPLDELDIPDTAIGMHDVL